MNKRAIQRLAIFALLLSLLLNFTLVYSVNAAASCQQAVDIALVLDSSGSIGDTNLGTVRDFAKGVVSSFQVGSNNAHFAVAEFGNNTGLRIGLSDSASAINGAIDAIAFSGDGTPMDLGISAGQGALAGGRSGVPHALILLTDGYPNDTAAALAAANAARNDGTIIFSVAVGGGADLAFLNQVSTTVFQTDFSNLASLAASIATTTCETVSNPNYECKLPLPEGSVVGEIVSPTEIFWEPGKISPGLGLPAGTTLWVIGMDETGQFYKAMLSCQHIWIPVGVMAPAMGDPVWQGSPLPTRVVS